MNDGANFADGDQAAAAVDDRPAVAMAWDEDFWEALLTRIDRGRVIPVVGRALSLVQLDGRPATVDRYVAARLAGKLGMDTAAFGQDFGVDAVVRERLRQKGDLDDLYAKVNGILKDPIEPPEAMVKLARIPSFRLFVTTAYDPLLARAIASVDGERGCDSIGYVPSNSLGCDFGETSAATRTVYHILGKASTLPEYVLTEDDLLEYMVALHDSQRRPARLFDQLRSHDLLILGGNLSDWLFRQFLRLAKHQRLSLQSDHREFVADESASSDRALVSFLSSFSPKTTVFSGGPQAFIDELWRRWSDRHGEADPPEGEGARGADPPARQGDAQCDVFVSYTREDADAARALVSGLRAKGFLVWFDDSSVEGAEDHTLKGSDNYEYRIRQAIKSCALFLPLISRNTERRVSDTFFRREWKWANERDEGNADEVGFILPVVVDDLDRGDLRSVPANFMRKHILNARGGSLSDALTRDIDHAVKALRR